MPEYTQITVNLSDGQLRKLVSHTEKNEPVMFRLSHDDLFNGNTTLFIGGKQYGKLARRYQRGQSAPIKLSQRLLLYNKRHGGNKFLTGNGMGFIGFGITTGFELVNILHYAGVKGFKGILTNERSYFFNYKDNESGIINLDDDPHRGTHWTAYFVGSANKYVYYFDSFGAPPPEAFITYIKKNTDKPILANTVIIQDYDSLLCGFFAVTFIIEMYHRISTFPQFIAKFDANDRKKNDEVVKGLSVKYFGDLLKV